MRDALHSAMGARHVKGCAAPLGHAGCGPTYMGDSGLWQKVKKSAERFRKGHPPYPKKIGSGLGGADV